MREDVSTLLLQAELAQSTDTQRESGAEATALNKALELQRAVLIKVRVCVCMYACVCLWSFYLQKEIVIVVKSIFYTCFNFSILCIYII